MTFGRKQIQGDTASVWLKLITRMLRAYSKLWQSTR